MTYDLKTRQDMTKKRGVSWVLAFGFTRFLSVIKSKVFYLVRNLQWRTKDVSSF